MNCGKGFDTTILQADLQEELLMANHFGIIGMKERVESLGGEFRMISKYGQGTIIRVRLACS